MSVLLGGCFGTSLPGGRRISGKLVGMPVGGRRVPVVGEDISVKIAVGKYCDPVPVPVAVGTMLVTPEGPRVADTCASLEAEILAVSTDAEEAPA